MINRKLLIISNGGVYKDLQGYDIDIANYQRFFSKPEAGYWDFGDNGDAILCETNKVTRKALLDYIKSENRKGPTYWVIVFVGHGYADSQGVDYLELCPEELDDDSSCAIKDIKAAIGQKSCCLLITDCCRAIPSYESGGAIRRLQMFSDSQQYSDHYIQRCMELYNQAIEKIPAGAFFLAQSCKYRQFSSGDDVYGGVYTYHLLKQARKIIKDARTNANSTATTFDTFSVSYIHMLAKKQMAAEGIEDQIPVFSGPRCNQPPFCVVPKENRLVFG